MKKIRKIIFIVLIALLFILSSCSSYKRTNKYVGRYYLYSNNEIIKFDYIELQEDNKVYAFNHGRFRTGTYSIINDKISIMLYYDEYSGYVTDYIINDGNMIDENHRHYAQEGKYDRDFYWYY